MIIRRIFSRSQPAYSSASLSVMHSRIGGLNSPILKPRQPRSVHRPHFFVFRQWLCILTFQLTAEILTAKEMLPSSPISLNDQRSPTVGAPLCCPCVFHYRHDFPSDLTNFCFFIIPQSIQTTSNLTNFQDEPRLSSRLDKSPLSSTKRFRNGRCGILPLILQKSDHF